MNKVNSDIRKLTDKVKKFGEEHFQWKSAKEIDEYVVSYKEHIGEEIADVAIYLLELADNLGIDLYTAVCQKIEKNNLKYPVSKSKSRHTKYTKL